jgi:YbbR domain-containing protein
LVDSVSAVELDVNLGGARDASVTFEGALTARTQSGNVVDVTLSEARARATFKINQVFIQRSFALNSSIVGQPQAGYAITSITIDPPVVLASGPKAIVNGLTQTFLNVEKLDITNATKTQTATRKVELPPNVSVDRQTVVVKVEISPLTITQTLYIGPAIENPPAGLAVAESGLTVAVHATGPYNLLNPPNPANFKVTVSLAGAAAGPGTFAVKVTAPAGVTVDPIDPITLTLRPAVVP